MEEKEGDVEFRSILFIPDSKPGDLAQGPGGAPSVKSSQALRGERGWGEEDVCEGLEVPTATTTTAR